MLVLHCPNCGAECAETELAAGGEAHLKRFGPGSADDEFTGYLWFHAARCTVTLEVFGTYTAQTGTPPQHIIDTIKARRPGWKGL